MSEQRKRTEYRKKVARFAISEKRRKLKEEAIAYKGGKCIKCGYNKCNAAMVFHHEDPSQKDFGIAENKKSRKFEAIKSELDKCILICSNCHFETHNEENQKSRLEKIKEIDSERSNKKPSVIKNCEQCLKEIKLYDSQIREHNFCSRDCKVVWFRDFGWPSDEELLKLKESIGCLEISKKINKSLASVYERFAKMNKK